MFVQYDVSSTCKHSDITEFTASICIEKSFCQWWNDSCDNVATGKATKSELFLKLNFDNRSEFGRRYIIKILKKGILL